MNPGMPSEQSREELEVGKVGRPGISLRMWEGDV